MSDNTLIWDLLAPVTRKCDRCGCSFCRYVGGGVYSSLCSPCLVALDWYKLFQNECNVEVQAKKYEAEYAQWRQAGGKHQYER